MPCLRRVFFLIHTKSNKCSKIRKMPEKPGNNKGYSTEKLELGIAIFTVIMYSIPKWSKME